jgi:hypothetical protein
VPIQPFERPVHHPDTASRIFSGEAVVITPADNMVRMFNRAGSRIWELMDGDRSVEAIAAALAEEYQIGAGDALSSVQRFADELAGRGLISVSRDSG